MTEASDGWYMRARGRILGPFTRAQLGSMRDRGQLSQFHEISQDRRNWVNASTVEWLFAQSSASQSTPQDIPLVEVVPSRTSDQVWFYNEAGTPYGPVTHEQIVSLIEMGRIQRDTPIWKEGYASWLALRDTPEFAFLQNANRGSGGVTLPPSSSGIGQGGSDSTSVTQSSRTIRVLMFAAGLAIVGVLGGLALLAIQRTRTAASRSIIPGPTETPFRGTTYVDSHMSNEIPQATGLVVAGATITDLKTGELVEIPGSRGTCFAIDPRGYLLTNRHVVEEFVKLSRADAKIEELEKTKAWRVKPNLWVYFSKERYEARVVYTSTAHDMAVLKVERRGPCFRLAANPDIIQGTHIYALGFPAASSQSLSVEGAIQKSMRKVSEAAESVLDESDFRYSITDGIISLIRHEAGTEYIQHSAEISGGNSGGPLIYEDGSVLGINTLVTFDQKRPGVGVKYYAIGIKQLVSDLQRKVPDLFN
jgi:S1-C subfamily serine protease